MPRRELSRAQPEPIEGTRAVAGDDDVRGLEQVLEHAAVGRAREIEQRGALAVTAVEVLPLRFGQLRRVDPQHVRAQQREGAGRDGPGDHAREIEDADAAQRLIGRPPLPPPGRSIREAHELDERGGAEIRVHRGVLVRDADAQPAR